MAIILEVTLTLNPGNQIAYLGDDTGLVVNTEYLISGTHLAADTRFSYKGTLDIVLTKQPLAVPQNNYDTPVAISNVPTPAVAPATAKYVYNVKNQLNAAGLNNDLGLRVLKTGDTMTGLLVLSGDPGVPLGAATKQYVDALRTYTIGAFLPLTGGTLSGRVTINDGSSYPISIVSPNGINCSVSYLVTGVRQWAVGISGSPGNFYIQDITAGGAIRFQIDTVGNVALQGALNVPGVLNAGGFNVASTGITYTSYEGHSISFGWASNSQLNVRVDGTFIGAMATTANLNSYLLLTGGSLSGALTIGGVLTCNSTAQFNSQLNCGNVTASGTINSANENTGALNCGSLTVGASGTNFQSGVTVTGGHITNNSGYYMGTPNQRPQLYDPSGNRIAFDVSSGYLTFPMYNNVGSPYYYVTGNNAQHLAMASPVAGPTGWELALSDNSGNTYGLYADVFSDARLKENIRDTTVDALAALLAIPVRAFEWTAEYMAHVVSTDQRLTEEKRVEAQAAAVPYPTAIGLIAQEVIVSIPEGARASGSGMTQPEGSPIPDDVLTLNDNAFIPYLIKAIQQLAARIEALEGAA